jgi:hypothetical protein
MTTVSELIKKLVELGAPLDAALYAAKFVEEREREATEEIARLVEEDRQRKEKRAEQKRKERMSRDSRATVAPPVARQSSDPSPLNGSPPTPYIRNIDNPPSLNTLTNNRHQPLFDAFWKAYPRKVGKGAAQKAWAAAVRKADPDRIIEAVERYAWPDEPSFIPHASTWLNGQRWEDELPNMGPRKPSEEELERMERERLAFLYDLHERTKGNGLQYDDEEA